MATVPEDHESFVLDQPGGNLALDLFVLEQRLGAYLAAAFGDVGVSPSHYAVYAQLASGPLTPGELMARLGLRPATLSGYLAAMQGRGHLLRTRNEQDGRSHRVDLTAEGEVQRRECQLRMRAAVRLLNASIGTEADVRELRTALASVDAGLRHAKSQLRAAP